MIVNHILLELSPKYGGPTASVPVQCKGIAEEGVSVYLSTYAGNEKFEHEMIQAGVQIINVPRESSFIPHYLQLSLKKHISTCQSADIFHYHGVWMPCNHWVAKHVYKTGKKAVINPRGDLETARINYNKWKKLKKLLAWWLYAKKDTQNAACIIATSEQERQAVRAIGVLAPIAIIPNGIEMDSFPESINHQHHKNKTILFLSRVNPIKGIEYLLDAWKEIPPAERKNWQIHIAGNSDPKDYIKELEDKAAGLGITDSVKFVGPITGADKIEKYQNCDLFVLPTLNENFGNVVAEAMMCELPVITTKNAPWKVLDDYKCGWWIDLSVENLVKAIREAIALNDEERWNLGIKGRLCIEENFASEAVAKKTMKVYEWVLGQGEKPDFVEVI